jgi:hypothetical protein
MLFAERGEALHYVESAGLNDRAYWLPGSPLIQPWALDEWRRNAGEGSAS